MGIFGADIDEALGGAARKTGNDHALDEGEGIALHQHAVGKGAEFKADETVVQMGFGRPLLNSLRIVVENGHGERAVQWKDRLVTAHPPARTRIARIDAQLRQMPRKNPR